MTKKKRAFSRREFLSPFVDSSSLFISLNVRVQNCVKTIYLTITTLPFDPVSSEWANVVVIPHPRLEDVIMCDIWVMDNVSIINQSLKHELLHLCSFLAYGDVTMELSTDNDRSIDRLIPIADFYRNIVNQLDQNKSFQKKFSYL